MNDKVKAFLNNLNRRAKETFKTKKVEDVAMREAGERAEWAYKKTGDPRIKEQLDKGFYRPKDKTVVDERSTREINRFMESEIKKAIKSGKIPPAKRDEFMRRIGR